jgi:hypothetical protein
MGAFQYHLSSADHHLGLGPNMHLEGKFRERLGYIQGTFGEHIQQHVPLNRASSCMSTGGTEALFQEGFPQDPRPGV